MSHPTESPDAGPTGQVPTTGGAALLFGGLGLVAGVIAVPLWTFPFVGYCLATFVAAWGVVLSASGRGWVRVVGLLLNALALAPWVVIGVRTVGQP